jgi:transcriptional regulator with XRE-family HTH domain
MKVRDRHLIRELRKERGITQRQMAVLAKTSQATISSIETGALTNISVDLGVHLAKWLDRRPRELFDHFDDDEFTAVKMRNEARLERQNSAESVT